LTNFFYAIKCLTVYAKVQSTSNSQRASSSKMFRHGLQNDSHMILF